MKTYFAKSYSLLSVWRLVVSLRRLSQKEETRHIGAFWRKSKPGASQPYLDLNINPAPLIRLRLTFYGKFRQETD